MVDIKCTKNDEFQIAPCQCPECIKSRPDSVMEEFNQRKPVIVTDKDIFNDGQIVAWKGPVFKCPECGEFGIMPPGSGCMVCLAPVTIQSRILTDLIKKIG